MGDCAFCGRSPAPDFAVTACASAPEDGSSHWRREVLQGFLWVYYSISTMTDELQATLPDGVIQRNRVVATDALGIEYLAPNADVRQGVERPSTA